MKPSQDLWGPGKSRIKRKCIQTNDDTHTVLKIHYERNANQVKTENEMIKLQNSFSRANGVVLFV